MLSDKSTNGDDVVNAGIAWLAVSPIPQNWGIGIAFDVSVLLRTVLKPIRVILANFEKFVQFPGVDFLLAVFCVTITSRKEGII